MGFHMTNEKAIFDAREHIPDIVKYCKEFPLEKRDKDANDVYSGEGMFARVCAEYGFKCTKFDIIYSKKMNIVQ